MDLHLKVQPGNKKKEKERKNRVCLDKTGRCCCQSVYIATRAAADRHGKKEVGSKRYRVIDVYGETSCCIFLTTYGGFSNPLEC